MKQHMQIGNEPTLTSVFRYIRLNHGYRGFYIGLFSLFLREIPYSCIQMPIYEAVKLRFLKQDKQFMNTRETVIAGFTAGSIAGILTTPIDVVKTNIMTQKDIIYSGFIDCYKKLYKEHGIKVFGRGAFYRFTAVGGVSAFFFLGYEVFMELFHDKF